MSLHFHALQVKSIQKETNDCVSVEFVIPENLKEVFTYKQGQNITVKAVIDGKEVRRTYSLCSTPLSNEFKVAIKRVDGGLFSTFANKELKTGDVVDVMPPIGRFYTELNPLQQKKYVAFAAGSGITPILSIITTTLLTEPKSSFVLVYGNKNHNSIIFKEALEGLKNKFLNRFQLIYILSREKTDADINYGRIDAEKLNQLSLLIGYKKADEFFICGPEEMIFCVKDFLEAKQIEQKNIHFELFTTDTNRAKKNIVHSSLDTSAKSKVSVNVDGRSFDFDLSFNSNSILDAALKQGADLPFACKGGVCCTCKAKLLEGQVKMDVHWGLEQDEIEQGFILTCQSRPLTEKIVVDFDIK
jgi:ring-1,2-phenylacetyl-CoA epoxidase subunit PaaE